MSKDADLIYVGDGRYLNGVPATDLSTASIAALAEKRGVKPDSLRASLLASGLYAESKPKEK